MSRATIASRVAGCALLLAVTWPATWPAGREGFPLSPYPMFSKPRPTVARVHAAVGVDARGQRHVLTPQLVGGSPRINLVSSGLRARIRAGDAAGQCTEIAQRVAASDREALVAIEVASEDLDVVASVAGAPPVRRRIHARCAVPR